MRAGIALVCRINDADTLLHTKPTITSHVVFATYNRHVIFLAERYTLTISRLTKTSSNL